MSEVLFFAASYKTPNPHAVKLTVLDSEEEWLADAHTRLRSWLQSIQAPHKASDFFSRIDFYLFMPPTQYHFIVPFNQHPDIYWQDEETIQIAKYIIKSQFKQVKEVDTRVLAFLSGALLDSKRELERIVFLSTVSEKDEHFQWDHLPKELLSGGPWFQELAQKAPKFIKLE